MKPTTSAVCHQGSDWGRILAVLAGPSPMPVGPSPESARTLHDTRNTHIHASRIDTNGMAKHWQSSDTLMKRSMYM